MSTGDVVLAAAAGVLGRIPTHPLDTCKTVAYTMDGRAGGFLQAARLIYREGGIRGFFRGGGLVIIGSGPGVALYLSTYEYVKRYLNLNGQESAFLHLCSGFIAEAVSCVFWVPIDVVKERTQTMFPRVVGRYHGSIDGLRTIIRNEGFFGLYKGYFVTVSSFGPASALYFMFYETFKEFLRSTIEPKFGVFGLSLTAALFGNSLACFITSPLEMVKTRYQVQRAVLTVNGRNLLSDQFMFSYSGAIEALRCAVTDGGVRGLWKGAVSRVLYTGPNAALTMSLYEWFKSVSRNDGIPRQL